VVVVACATHAKGCPDGKKGCPYYFPKKILKKNKKKKQEVKIDYLLWHIIVVHFSLGSLKMTGTEIF
jgi:hypothetical protein